MQKNALKIGDNELIIRIGADRESVTKTFPSGFDFEKEHYIPGIFDAVELIMSGTPNVVNVQVAPDLAKQSARVLVWLVGNGGGNVTVEVREAKSKKQLAKHR